MPNVISAIRDTVPIGQFNRGLAGKAPVKLTDGHRITNGADDIGHETSLLSGTIVSQSS